MFLLYVLKEDSEMYLKDKKRFASTRELIRQRTATAA